MRELRHEDSCGARNGKRLDFITAKHRQKFTAPKQLGFFSLHGGGSPFLVSMSKETTTNPMKYEWRNRPKGVVDVSHRDKEPKENTGTPCVSEQVK